MNPKLRFLLLQVRNPGDPMIESEIDSFARTLGCDKARMRRFDLLAAAPTPHQLQSHDVALLGGSGHYSAAGEGPWLERILDALRDIHARRVPMFASCWGFQAMARAMGGRVVHDLSRAELGTRPLRLTEHGLADPIFAPLGEEFHGQMGHEDRVAELPPDTTLLASSDRVENQAYRFDGRPIYCTQFHPELDRSDLLARVRTYPEYIERIAQLPPERFNELLYDATETGQLLVRFVKQFVG